MIKHYKMGAKYQNSYGMLEFKGTEDELNTFMENMAKAGYKIISTFEE